MQVFYAMGITVIVIGVIMATIALIGSILQMKNSIKNLYDKNNDLRQQLTRVPTRLEVSQYIDEFGNKFEALEEHLGLEFKHQPATPSRIKLVKPDNPTE